MKKRKKKTVKKKSTYKKKTLINKNKKRSTKKQKGRKRGRRRQIKNYDEVLVSINEAQLEKKELKIAVEIQDEFMVQNLLEDAGCSYTKEALDDRINFNIKYKKETKPICNVNDLDDDFFENNFLI